MTFVAQVLLSDLPESPDDKALLSFHYCLECNSLGCGSFGHGDARSAGHDVRIFEDASQLHPDGNGPSGGETASFVACYESRKEIMSIPDVWQRGVEYDEEPEDDGDDSHPLYAEDFERAGFTDYGTVAGDKLGGWPSWIQDAGWIDCPHGRRYEFVGQLADYFLPNGPWAAGGNAYLWACPPACPDRRGDLSIQFT